MHLCVKRMGNDLLSLPALFWFPVRRSNFNPNQIMNTHTKAIALAAVALAIGGTAVAEDSVAGKWKAQFDSQIGVQKYTFEFKIEDGKLTGKAIGEREMGTNEVQIIEGKLNKDEISFVEPLKFQDNEIRIEYKGKISGDEIKLHRKVGDLAEYDIVAKRVKETGAKPEVKPEAKPEGKSDVKPAEKPAVAKP
jgi:hypothetical protein